MTTGRRSQVVGKMLNANRTIKDWILISLGEMGEPANINRLCKHMFQKGFTTKLLKPAYGVRIALSHLMEEDRVEIVDSSPKKYKLNHFGLACAMEIWFKELNFDKDWATEEVVGTANHNFPEVMHDALMDANASYEVVEASNHPVFRKWLMAIIKEKYAPKS